MPAGTRLPDGLSSLCRGDGVKWLEYRYATSFFELARARSFYMKWSVKSVDIKLTL